MANEGNMIRFDLIRAFSLRVGDKVPVPLSSGGWDKREALSITSIARDFDGGMTAFTLCDGRVLRAFPMNIVPFLRAI